MTSLILSLIALAFAVSLPATLAARAVGRRLRALDGAGVAGQVKAPARRVPNTGGVGIYLGIALPMVAGLAVVWFEAWEPALRLFPRLGAYLPGILSMMPAAGALLGCITVLHLLGLVDDRRPMAAWIKLVVMLAVAAATVVLTGSRLLTLLDGRVGGVWLSTAITVLWIGAVTNAFNFLDNMDGLSGGLAAICGGAFMTTALLAAPPQWFVAAVLALLVGSALGFLVLNFPWRVRRTGPDGRTVGGASIFMGDGGSLIIGFLLAVLSVRITYIAPAAQGSPAAAAAGWHLLLTPFIILAVPLYDLCSVTIIRLRQGRSPFVGDLQHFSHRLVAHGLSSRAAVLIIYGCAAATAISAIAMPRLAPWQGVLVAVQTLVILGVLAGFEWAGRP